MTSTDWEAHHRAAAKFAAQKLQRQAAAAVAELERGDTPATSLMEAAMQYDRSASALAALVIQREDTTDTGDDK